MSDREYSNASLIALVQDKIDQTRTALQRVVEAQDEDSDEGNEEKLQDAANLLDDFEATIEDLVP